MEHLVCATHFMSMQQGVACLSQVSGVKQLLVETLATVSLKQVPPSPWPQFPPLLNGYDAEARVMGGLALGTQSQVSLPEAV